MPHRTNRRGFLRDAALAVAALPSIPTHTLHSFRRAQASAVGRVIIVGAGPAGLAVAQRLREAGTDVVVLEARPRAGGRVRTVRAAFDGLHGEAGAARIAEAHTFTLDWINRLGLSVKPFGANQGAPLSVVRGQRIRGNDSAQIEKLPLNLHPDERGLTPAALLKRAVGDVIGDLADVDPMPETYARWQNYDRQTWPQWLHARGASEDAVALMTLGADPFKLSALYVLRQIALHGDSQHYYTIAGGMDLLPKKLADSLGNAIKYNAAVTAIRQDAAGVDVSCLENGRTVSLRADRVVVAIPFSTLRNVTVDPPFAADKMQAIAELAYYPATRILLQTRERFWIKAGANGAVRTDFALETWDDSAGQAGSGGMLSATIGGRMDESLAQIATDDRLRTGEKMIAQAFPDIAAMTAKGFVRRWSDEPWSRGAFAAFTPGQMSSFMPVAARVEGRVHFAGEHTSPWTGWMEGALRSGERVVEEILKR
jgi:monoamine oxidase